MDQAHGRNGIQILLAGFGRCMDEWEASKKAADENESKS